MPIARSRARLWPNTITAFSLLNAKCNDLSQGHCSPPKTLQNWGKNAQKPNRPNFAPLPVRGGLQEGRAEGPGGCLQRIGDLGGGG